MQGSLETIYHLFMSNCSSNVEGWTNLAALVSLCPNETATVKFNVRVTSTEGQNHTCTFELLDTQANMLDQRTVNFVTNGTTQTFGAQVVFLH